MPRPKPLQRLRSRGLLVDRGVRQESVGVCGPYIGTLRDPLCPRSWIGLSVTDRGLLERYLERLGGSVGELHTDVRVGRVPVLAEGLDTERNRKLISSLWPRRIDAAIRNGTAWSLIECKPDANHYVLGQMLCYAYWWGRDVGGCELERVVLVTDVADSDVKPVLAACGIEVVELGLEGGVGEAEDGGGKVVE